MTQQPHYDANDVLMGGAGAPAWKFDQPGVRKQGTVTSPPQSRQERDYDPNNPGAGAPKVFPSGDPIMGVFVEVQTTERDSVDDDGKRTFYIEGKRLKDAVRAGVRAAGANGLEVGGQLDVTLTHYDEANDRRSGRNWQIVYTPAGNAALMSGPVAPTEVQAAPAWAQPIVQQQAAAPQPAPAITPEQAAAFEAWQKSQQH